MGKKKRRKNKGPKPNNKPKSQPEPASSEAKSEDAKPEETEPAQAEKSEAKAEPAKAEKQEQSKPEPKSEPAKAEQPKSEPAKAEKPKSEPKPAAKPVAEPVTIEEIEFSKSTMAEFEAMVKRYPERRGALLPTLRLIERDFGNISDAGMAYAAKLIGVSPAYVLGVVTFYTHYRRPSDGKYVIELCRTLPCALRGADALADHACKKLGINIGETTADGKITLKSVECIAACGYAPALQLNGCYHEKLTPEIFDTIVDGLE